jgi:GNAT superfamily N-acetyltransferase
MKPAPTVALRRGRLRRAVPADCAAIEAVMKASAGELSKGFYSEQQIPSVIAHISSLDPVLIEDETYFVIEDVPEGEGDGDGDDAAATRATRAPTIVACGGWSRRDKLFTGGGASAGGTSLLVPGRDPARIRAMFVHPAAARRGFGGAILAAGERDAAAEGFTAAELMSTAPGEPLYLACGYQILERVDLALPDGCVVALARMRKPLAAAP